MTKSVMTADDPRHGTATGYRAGCRSQCCRDAVALYEKTRVFYQAKGVAYAIDAEQIRRRVHALMAIGWTIRHIAEAGGWTTDNGVLSAIRPHRKFVQVKTYKRMVDVYDRLCMTPGPSLQSRTKARINGWHPPLAWDNIDDLNEAPASRSVSTKDKSIVDDVLIQRALSGVKVKLNRPERVEVTRRWLNSGRPQAELDRIQGWNSFRDKRLEDRSERAA